MAGQEIKAATPRARLTAEDRPGASLGEVAEALGVTRQAVQQIEVRAIRKCRAWCERHGYRLEDLLDTGRPSDRRRPPDNGLVIDNTYRQIRNTET